MLTVHGWAIYAHPLLLGQLERLTSAVAAARAKDPAGYQSSANAKLLAALRRLIFETIPGDPSRGDYRQGITLGADRRHWFRAKFGNGRFRLFFRYDSRARILVFAWVNDETTLRTYGSRSDAYAVFRSMLDRDAPPDDWADLLREASDPAASARLAAGREP